MSVFVIDSNFLIQAHRVTYPLDVAESYWSLVSTLARKGTIISIDKVKKEIYQNDDELKSWCEEFLPDTFFKEAAEAIEDYHTVINWAAGKSDHYMQKALDEFLDADEADAWLVAFALKNKFPLITHEVSNPARKNKIKIPEPCDVLGVHYMNTIDLFRHLGVKF